MFNTLNEYFIWCLNHKSYENKQWVYALFGVIKLDNVNTLGSVKTYPGKLFSNQDEVLAYNSESGELVPVTWFSTKSDEPLIKFNDKLKLKKGDLPNVTQDVETSYTKAWFNAQVLIRNFNSVIPYYNEQWHPKAIENIVVQALKDKTVEVKDYWEFVRSALHLTAYSQLFVPSATDATITVPKEVIELRDKLVKQYEGQLHDPVVVAKIETEVSNLDKKLMQSDRSAVFFKKGKDFAIVRKRMWIMYGGEKSIEDPNKIELVIPSLNEGLQTAKLPEMLNSTRNGIYSRGAGTAKGGESAKFLARVFQNSSVVKDDCGDKCGAFIKIDSMNYSMFIGRYLMGNTKPLDAAGCKALIGKKAHFRSPLTCKCEKTDYCKVCMGEKTAQFKKSLGNQAVKFGSVMMLIEMAAIKVGGLYPKGWMRKNSLIAGTR